MKTQNSPLWTRLTWAIIGQALPEAPVLRGYLRQGFSLVAAAVFSAIIGACLAMLAGYGLYQFMLAEGLSSAGALTVCAGLGLLLLVIGLQQASSAIQRIASVKNEVGFFKTPPRGPGESSPIESVIAEFLDGLLLSSDDDTPEKEIHIIRKTRVEKPDVTLVKNELDISRQ